jgi:hypothetical protein
MLNRFYEDNVKMTRDETNRNVKIVMPLVNDILTYVHQTLSSMITTNSAKSRAIYIYGKVSNVKIQQKEHIQQIC